MCRTILKVIVTGLILNTCAPGQWQQIAVVAQARQTDSFWLTIQSIYSHLTESLFVTYYLLSALQQIRRSHAYRDGTPCSRQAAQPTPPSPMSQRAHPPQRGIEHVLKAWQRIGVTCLSLAPVRSAWSLVTPHPGYLFLAAGWLVME